jgi:hypothetical protein
MVDGETPEWKALPRAMIVALAPMSEREERQTS